MLTSRLVGRGWSRPPDVQYLVVAGWPYLLLRQLLSTCGLEATKPVVDEQRSEMHRVAPT